MSAQPHPPAVRETHSLKEVAFADHGLGAHLVPQSMADVVRFAETMARGAIAIRKHLRDNPGACLAVTLQALDWGMNPISVANKSYAVNDQLAYESQLIAAVIHARAPIVGRPRYTYTGETGTTRQCRVEVTTKEGEVLDYTSPQVSKITTKNSPLWKSDEDQQLGYFSIRSLARRHFPELLLGVYDREEAAAMRDVTPNHSPDLRARLEARKEAPKEGFNASQAQEQTSEQHDPNTGEIIDAEVEDATHAAEDDFPGDRQQADDGAAQEQQQGSSLAQRIGDWKKRLADAPTTTKAKSIWAASANLRNDIDAADADTVPMTTQEMEQHFNARFEELERAEREANGK